MNDVYQPTESFLGGVSPTPTPTEAPSGAGKVGAFPREEPVTPYCDHSNMFRPDGEGDPPAEGSYDRHVNSFFESYETEARMSKDEDRLKEYSAGRTGMEAVLKEFQVGEVGAKQLVSALREHIDKPTSPEQIAAASVTTLKKLEAKWGVTECKKMITGAKRVLAEADKKMPGLIATLDRTGAGSDPRIITLLANAAKRKGYVK